MGKDEGKGSDELDQCDKAENTGGPAEADNGEEADEDDRVDDTTDCCTHGDKADGQGTTLREGHGDKCGAGRVKDAGPNTDTPALREQNLPVDGAEGEHHHAEDGEEGADVEK